MPQFRFYHAIEVRYGDLDPQGHVNNAKHLTYMEQARLSYISRLGLWEGGSFMTIGIILAEARVTYLEPVLLEHKVRVGVCVSKIGNKSIVMEHIMEDEASGAELASGSTVLVAYDYHTQSTIPVPDNWRKAISEFEGIMSPTP